MALRRPDARHPAERYVRTFLTWEEIGGEPFTEQRVVDLLATMSVYDCLQALGRLSCMVQANPVFRLATQQRVMQRLGWPAEVRDAVEKLMGAEGELRPLFFPQQIVQLARLAVRHADPRPPDDFAEGALANDFVRCVLGVNDTLEEPGLDPDDPTTTVPWIVRQAAINGRHSSPLLWTRYFDVLVRIWDEVATPEAFDAAAAFRRYTQLSMSEWLAVGFGVYTRFLHYGKGTSEDFALQPEQWFARSRLQEEQWRPWLAHNAASVDELRDALREEEHRYGPTQYRCQTFESRPLLWMPDGSVVPIALDSLERRATEGMFYELADGAQAEGRQREHFTSPFGAVFEEFVCRAWERILPAVGVTRVHRARPYEALRDGRRATVDSTDAILDAGSSVVFCEVVARRPRVATLTRGTWESFQQDLETGVLKKTRQLDLNIADYRRGALELDGLRFEGGQSIWPMLVMVEGFPTMPPVPGVIAAAITERGLLANLPPLAILSAEDLGHLEALVEAGFSVAEVLRLWKGDPEMAVIPFQNFVDSTDDPRRRDAQQARFYTTAWNELTDSMLKELFGQDSMAAEQP